nr:unnamed protein product [Spirometra erinaceieuropaei]
MLSDMLMDAYRDERPGTSIAYRTGRHLDSRRMQTLTRLPTTSVHDLPSSGDCALNTTTEEHMQWSVEPFAAGCANFGLIISMKKTVVMHQPPLNAAPSVPHIHVNSTELKTANISPYLGSTFAASTSTIKWFTGS